MKHENQEQTAKCATNTNNNQINDRSTTPTNNKTMSPNSGKKEKLPWHQMFEKLKDYKKTHGDINMRTPEEFIHNHKLGRWVGNQRLYYKHYKAGNRNKRTCRGMCQERIDKFESIGFELRPVEEMEGTEEDWGGDGAAADGNEKEIDPWKEKYDELLKFRSEHGHVYVPTPKENEEYTKLHEWLQIQRSEFSQYRSRHTRSPSSPKLAMTDTQFDLLTEIRLEDPSPEWEKKFERLCKYKELHGDANVPRRYQPDPKLGKWVDCQRTGYKSFRTGNKRHRNGMNPNRIQRLEDVGFKWSLKGINKNHLTECAKKVKETIKEQRRQQRDELAQRKAAAKKSDEKGKMVAWFRLWSSCCIFNIYLYSLLLILS